MTSPPPIGDDPGTAVAIGWASVDLDRTALELAPLLAEGEAFRSADPCRHLGARCRIAHTAADSGLAPILVLLEPSTEGRLAATLARHGEGWCATWFPGDTTEADDPTGGRRSAPAMGPLGEERLVLGGPVSGPHRLLVTPATIDP